MATVVKAIFEGGVPGWKNGSTGRLNLPVPAGAPAG